VEEENEFKGTRSEDEVTMKVWRRIQEIEG
jgi:hypothetical protein